MISTTHTHTPLPAGALALERARNVVRTFVVEHRVVVHVLIVTIFIIVTGILSLVTGLP